MKFCYAEVEIVIIFILLIVVDEIVNKSRGDDLEPEQSKKNAVSIFPEKGQADCLDDQADDNEIFIKDPDEVYDLGQPHKLWWFDYECIVFCKGWGVK